jgi:Flp pilus assembly protein TadD
MYHANLGRVEMAANNFSRAIAAWRQALQQDPHNADLYSDMSGAQLKTGAVPEALDNALQALRIQPDHSLALVNKGLALAMTGAQTAALRALEEASDLQPDNSEIWFQLGCLYQQADSPEMAEMAEVAFRRVLGLAPGHVDAANNLGNILRQQMRFDDAKVLYESALQSDPQQSDLHSNLGVTLQEAGDPDAAITCYRKAIEIDPANAEARRNLGMALLQTGAFEDGWAEYEWRWKTRHFAPLRRNWPQPRWQGQPLPEHTVLVHCEQGFGDSIQFARYLPLVAARVGRLVVEAPQELASLIRGMDGVGDVVVAGTGLPFFDQQIPLLSLPYVFATTLASIPASVPYFTVTNSKMTDWKDRLQKQPGQKLIGVAWKGSQAHQRNQMRSPGLDVFAPLFALAPDIRFISLQKDPAASDRAEAGRFAHLEDVSGDLHDFEDTAALICNLDGVVSPDTAVAHLAGALGIASWILLPAVAEWRWLRGRTDSPWYPNATLVRQQKIGDWESAVEAVHCQLADR